jgi:hypothetical protein
MSLTLDYRARMYRCIAAVEDAQNRIDELFAEAQEEVLTEQADLARVAKSKQRPLRPMELAARAEAKMITWPDFKNMASRRDRMTQQALMYGTAALVERG